jgi:predicted acyl esterase
MRGERRLSAGEIVPVEIAIWPMGLRFHAGEQLKLTIKPFSNEPMQMPFGSVKLDFPAHDYTFDPAQPPKMVALGGDAATSPAWSRDQAVMPPSRNQGRHRIHIGGRWDSHLLVPLKLL